MNPVMHHMSSVLHHMSSVLHHMGSLTDHMISVMRSHELSNASHDITISTMYMGVFWSGKIKLANLANRKPFVNYFKFRKMACPPKSPHVAVTYDQ